MKLSRHLSGQLGLVAFALGLSCSPTPPPVPLASQPPTPVAAPPVAKTATRRAPASASRGAPPQVTAPMAGEPAASALSEARLATKACADHPVAVAAEVAKMRTEVNAELKRWHDGQPGCWHAFREQWEWDRKYRWGQSFGSGGLGLSGIGEGGGGYGEGIGLGAIGTIGHGSGGVVRRARVASDTNNQIAGVDEADIVKTDGRYVYLAANGALRIVEAMDPKVVSVTKLPGVVRDLFVEGDRAVVYASSAAPKAPCTYGYDCRFAGDGTSTHVTVLDIRNRARPHVVRRIDLSGSLMTSRRVGTAVHTVVADGDADRPYYDVWPQDMPMCGTDEKTVKARFAQLKVENERKIRQSVKSMPSLRENGVVRSLCGTEVLQTAHGDGRAFTSIVSFDLAHDQTPATTTMIQSRPGAVFASADALYLSVVHQKRGGAGWYSFHPSVDEVSEVHKFRIGEDATKTRYVGSGIVPGHVLNQFAMDEWSGYLRIATTRGRVPDPKVESVVSVLAEGQGHNLVRVGAIEKIAPGEDIRSVRFDGDRGYIVTFKKTDPLFVIDLFDAAQPKILGELKIPGFSTYMHRIDATHLLSIGFDADDKGDFAYFDGIILQLFDVAEPTKPKLLHKAKIGTRGSSSEAATNHLAFNYLSDRGVLAIPMTECKGGGDGTYGRDLAFSGLYVYDVDVETGFKRLGGIDHGRAGASCDTWWSNANSAVKRSLFLDDLVYSIATDRVKVQRLGHFGEDVASISLMP